MKYFTPPEFAVNFHTINSEKPEVVYEDKGIVVTCFPLKHRVPAWGYLFREKPKLLNMRKDMIEFYRVPISKIPDIRGGADFVTDEGETVSNRRLTLPPVKPKSYAYCSDTMYSVLLPQIIKDVDLLYHEATYGNDEKQQAVKTYHSTAEEAAKIALDANAKKLVIGHFSSRYKNINQLLEEAKKVFQNTEAAEDGKVFEI